MTNTTNTNRIAVDVVSGQIVFWTPKAAAEGTLQAVCKRHNIEQSFRTWTPGQALEWACNRHFDGTEYLVRPTNRRDTRSIVREVRHKGRNEYEPAARVQMVVRPGGGADSWAVIVKANNTGESDYDLASALTSAARKKYGMVKGSHVGLALGQIVVNHFAATRLRPRGGVYFVPKSKVEAWDAFTTDLTESTGAQVYGATQRCDANTMAAVIESSGDDLRRRYVAAIERMNAIMDEPIDSDLSVKKQLTQQRRKEREKSRCLDELEEIKRVAEQVDASFRGATQLAAEIDAEIQNEIAMAVLMFGTN